MKEMFRPSRHKGISLDLWKWSRWWEHGRQTKLGQGWGLQAGRARWGWAEWLPKKAVEAEGRACDSMKALGKDTLVWWWRVQ